MFTNPSILFSARDYCPKGTKSSLAEAYQAQSLPVVDREKNPRKILFVLDYPEDPHASRLLDPRSSYFKLLADLTTLAKNLVSMSKFPMGRNCSWMACSLYPSKHKGYSVKTSGVELARFHNIVCSYKPDTIILLGDNLTRKILPAQIQSSNGTVSHWHGSLVPMLFTSSTGKEFKTKVCPCLSLFQLSQGSQADAAMMGYMAYKIANGIVGRRIYKVDSEALLTPTCVLIDSVAKFDKLISNLRTQPIVSVDTETNDLSKTTNVLLSIQFSKCTKIGYFLPIHHKDSPFTSKELVYIKDVLRGYFEGDNENKYHIYTNATFDLNVLRNSLKCRYMANNVYDILMGEYGHDENLKFLSTLTGEWHYSLGNLSCQYGFFGYNTASFGKKHRASISRSDLTEDLILYGVWDVLLPFAIHEQQLIKARDTQYPKFMSIVTEQLSDTLHGFSVMGTNGSPVDIDYLFHLQSPDSPIEDVIRRQEASLMQHPALVSTNKFLAKQKGIPLVGLFTNTLPTLFSFRKDDHKHLLFFDVLKLSPLSLGASGKGKLDKAFQSKYSDNPVVASYTALEKAKKLKNSFVKSFITLYGTNKDFRADNCIRPDYQITPVVTGRTSASDPNLQQIPSHSELGKHIKRLFISPDDGIWIKADYRVHEVRGWGLIAFDKALAGVFKQAKQLRDQYRLWPTPELKVRLEKEADIHVINAAYFFSLDVVTKEDRNAVKAIIFGLIYQMSLATLAKNLGKELAFTTELAGNFNKRFPKGMKWIKTAKKMATETLFYENPLGFRRHLWGYGMDLTLPEAKRIHNSLDRKAVNSPIQGMCAQFMAIGNRLISKAIFDIQVSGREFSLKIRNSVHDSLENTVAYEDILESTYIIEDRLTTGVRKEVFRRHGFKLVVGLEIDFELGDSLATCEAWDNSIEALETIVFNALLEKKYDRKRDIPPVLSLLRVVFSEKAWSVAPDWMKEQRENVGWKLDKTKYAKHSVTKNISLDIYKELYNLSKVDKDAKKLLNSSRMLLLVAEKGYIYRRQAELTFKKEDINTVFKDNDTVKSKFLRLFNECTTITEEN